MNDDHSFQAAPPLIVFSRCACSGPYSVKNPLNMTLPLACTILIYLHDMSGLAEAWSPKHLASVSSGFEKILLQNATES